MILSKEHEGKIIFAIGTGNNARGAKGKAIQFEVVKVKLKYAELRDTRLNSTDNYSLTNGATQSAINSGYTTNAGYKFFKNEIQITEYKDNIRINMEIREIVSYHRSLPYHKSKRILSILKESDDA